MDLKIFGSRLKELRNERGVSHEKLANATDMAYSNISAWELGKKMPSGESLWKLADYFGVSIDYLVGRTDV